MRAEGLEHLTDWRNAEPDNLGKMIWARQDLTGLFAAMEASGNGSGIY